MGTESIEASFLSIFALISFFIFLLLSKYSHKIRGGALLDEDFSKPQAFHDTPVTRSGGTAVIISLSIFFVIYYLLYSKILYEYIFISYSMFLIGVIDDLKIKIKPFKRLLIMILMLFTFIYFFQIKILNIDIPLLEFIYNNHFFSSIFTVLCFLFIINGANLIDGFNGLLSLNLIIINVILAYINLENANLEFSLLIIAQIIILLSFLLFNFPKAKIFMGDGGAYFFGALTSLNIIYTNNFNSKTSSFFFCILLFYIFFEVFFSFFRKIYQKKSPFRPDGFHLHMLIFKSLKIKTKIKDCNYLTSLAINAAYIILILPSILMRDNASFAMYWFFSLLVIYLLIFSRLYSFIKKQIDI